MINVQDLTFIIPFILVFGSYYLMMNYSLIGKYKESYMKYAVDSFIGMLKTGNSLMLLALPFFFIIVPIIAVSDILTDLLGLQDKRRKKTLGELENAPAATPVQKEQNSEVRESGGDQEAIPPRETSHDAEPPEESVRSENTEELHEKSDDE